jgi:glutaredoxin 3
VVVFSKSWCPYCRKALEALDAAGVTQPFIVDLTDNDKAQQIQATLQSMTGRRTVPNVFVGGKSIGGGDETSRFQAQGKLIPMLVEAGALKPQKAIGNDEQQIESCNLAEQSCVEKTIHKYPVLMFTLSWCPECKRTLELLSSIVGSRSPHLIDLDDYDKETQLQIRTNMMEVSGRRSVPNLYIGGEFFGGYAQTLRMHEEGQVVAKLQEVGWYINEQVVEEEM